MREIKLESNLNNLTFEFLYIKMGKGGDVNEFKPPKGYYSRWMCLSRLWKDTQHVVLALGYV